MEDLGLSSIPEDCPSDFAPAHVHTLLVHVRDMHSLAGIAQLWSVGAVLRSISGIGVFCWSYLCFFQGCALGIRPLSLRCQVGRIIIIWIASVFACFEQCNRIYVLESKDHVWTTTMEQKSSAFQQASIFRRTGMHSFAVQLQGAPGVVEVHCIDEDWGHMASTWKSAQDLEDRLCAIGTRSMFVWDEQVQRVVPSRVNTMIGWEEGVEIALGPYDPGRRAFVQCRVRVVERSTMDCLAEKEALSTVSFLPEPVPVASLTETVAQSRSKRVFKWLVWRS